MFTFISIVVIIVLTIASSGCPNKIRTRVIIGCLIAIAVLISSLMSLITTLSIVEVGDENFTNIDFYEMVPYTSDIASDNYIVMNYMKSNSGNYIIEEEHGVIVNAMKVDLTKNTTAHPTYEHYKVVRKYYYELGWWNGFLFDKYQLFNTRSTWFFDEDISSWLIEK